MISSGTRVRLTADAKDNFVKNDCQEHVDEFGHCEGVVIGPAFEDAPQMEYVDVRWIPSRLRYSYPVSALEVIAEKAL